MMKVKSCVIAATIIAMTTGVSVAQTSEAQSNAGNGSVNPIESMPPIARAVVDDDRKAIAALLKEEPSAINDTVRAKKGERAGYTPLILATALSNPDMAKYLIDHGAEITKVDDYNRSAFWYAAFNGNTELTEILV